MGVSARICQETETTPIISTEGIQYKELLTRHKVVNSVTERVERGLQGMAPRAAGERGKDGIIRT